MGRELMPRGPATFRQRDAAALIKAAQAAGLHVVRVELDKDGKIVLITSTTSEASEEEVSEWDGVGAGL
jgi:hypothetical protein